MDGARPRAGGGLFPPPWVAAPPGINRALDYHPPEAILKNPHNIPINIFGQNKQQRMTEIRRRYEMLFGLLLNSGLRIGEALALKASDVRLVAGTAKSVRVIGKGDKERLVPLPGAFGAVFGFWLKDRSRTEFVFARAPGQKAGVGASGARLPAAGC
ncbi:MAG: tyrosine-type recombinase/integrase [Chromatiales bacterium]|nr:tyrosine-type recombinase/integrase [Chromatiales bacterium]